MLRAQRGIHVRVVSVPCWESFMRQSAERQAEVLPAGIRRVAIEAGRTDGWRGVVGLEGLVIGIDEYGASAPANRLQQEYGLTAKQVAHRIAEWL